MAIHLLSNSQGHLVGEWVDNGPGKNSGGKKTARVVRVNYDSNSTWELALGQRCMSHHHLHGFNSYVY